MKYSTYDYRECLQRGDAKYFFGKGGYVEVQDGLPVAHITNKNYKLATPDFSDMQQVQELPVSPLGFQGMLTHLGVPKTSDAQRKLVSYKNWVEDNKTALPDLR